MTWNGLRFFKFSLLWLALSALWTALLSIVLPEMADQYALDSAWGRGRILALFLGVGAGVSAVTQVVVGWLSDKDTSPWRRWKYLLGGLPLTALPLILLARSDSVGEVTLALVLLQLTANAATGPYQALIPDEVPPQKHGLASTWMGLFQHGGQIVGSVVAASLLGAELGGLAVLETALFVGLMVGLACLWSALPAQRVSPKEEVLVQGLWPSLKSALGGGHDFKLLIQSRLVINIGFYLVVSFLLYYVGYALGFEQTRKVVTTQLLGCMVVGGLVGGLVIGPRADKQAKKPLLYKACAVTGAGLLGFVCAPRESLPVAMLFATMAGFGFGGFAVVDWSLACNLAPPATSALSMGVWNLAAVLPQIIAPGVFGPISDAAIPLMGAEAAYRGVMLMVIVFLLLGCLRLRPLKEPNVTKVL